MSTPASPSRSPPNRVAKPAALLALTGLVLGYSLMNPGVQGMPEPGAPGRSALAEAVPALEVAAISPRLAAMSGRAGPRPGLRDIAVADQASAIALLHRNLGDASVQASRRDQVIAELESEFRSEPVDATWSAQSEDRIDSAAGTTVMTSAGFVPQDLTMDCRSRTCRISARFSNSIDAQSWADRLLTQMGDTISQARTAVVPQTDGSYEVRVFGGRKRS